ncbi:uncharacterized protein G2W53_041817 [Senna tora]|uniref:Uncharacterized protein n=1 Tax=Senna tora TaxID=362788 RepID=A0A834SGB1_9FABA|nr:uncharacterized protein G2W53_041817 [Senna tora]
MGILKANPRASPGVRICQYHTVDPPAPGTRITY